MGHEFLFFQNKYLDVHLHGISAASGYKRQNLAQRLCLKKGSSWLSKTNKSLVAVHERESWKTSMSIQYT